MALAAFDLGLFIAGMTFANPYVAQGAIASGHSSVSVIAMRRLGLSPIVVSLLTFPQKGLPLWLLRFDLDRLDGRANVWHLCLAAFWRLRHRLQRRGRMRRCVSVAWLAAMGLWATIFRSYTPTIAVR
jgi:hypothetical protein